MSLSPPISVAVAIADKHLRHRCEVADYLAEHSVTAFVAGDSADLEILLAHERIDLVVADVLRQALQAGAIAADAVAAVICDADAHTPRATELFGTTLKALPHLDPAEQMCRLGTIAAHGSAGALLVVAAAAARVTTDGQPCLALSLGDSHWRLALLLRPVPAGPEAGAAAPSLTPTAKAPEARR